ncbi:MAG: cytidine deaminase [Thermotogae bacterium]|nr:cytidine deaminase [Thermotogota bacterium]
MAKVSLHLLRELYSESVKILGNSYAPYSNFHVGAAVLMENDRGERKMFTGTNVENASYGLTVCAERVALLKGVSEGYRRVVALSLVAESDGEIKEVVPCGACLQVMAEFGDENLPVYNGAKVFKLGDLLPHTFNLRV